MISSNLKIEFVCYKHDKRTEYWRLTFYEENTRMTLYYPERKEWRTVHGEYSYLLDQEDLNLKRNEWIEQHIGFTPLTFSNLATKL